MLEGHSPTAETATPQVAYDAPNPELAAAVRDSLATLEALMARYPLASHTFDGLVQWTGELRRWRSDLFLAACYLTAAGFVTPDVDMNLEASATLFVETWGGYLAKVRPLVDPVRAGCFYVVQ